MESKVRRTLAANKYDTKVFINALIAFRTTLGYNMTEFAKYAGISQSAYARIEAGDFKRISISLVEFVAKEMNKSVDEILPPLDLSDDELEILKWANKPIAMPFLKEAYKKYMNRIAKNKFRR